MSLAASFAGAVCCMSGSFRVHWAVSMSWQQCLINDGVLWTWKSELVLGTGALQRDLVRAQTQTWQCILICAITAMQNTHESTRESL